MSRSWPGALREGTLAMMRGSYLDVEEHGQIALGFRKGVSDEDRAEFRAKLSELLRPRRKYAKRIKIDPLVMEHAGARALAEDDPDPSSRGSCVWFVRIYYMSEGDELLCFDAGPFVRVTADRAKSEAEHHVVGSKWCKLNKEWVRPADDKLPQPEVWHATRESDAITARTNGHKARHVMLPSQRAILQHKYNEAIAKDPTLARSQPEE